jgi:FixJ family two-component response regulator
MISNDRFVAVVDDDVSVARAISRLLRAVGIAVDTFTSGSAFVDQILTRQDYRPQCVILDVCMPDVNGLEVQRLLAGVPLSLIFITAHDLPESRDRALSAGAIGYLRKPFNASQLLGLIRTVMP